MLLSVMHVVSWILPGMSWTICAFVRRPIHKNTDARNSLDLDLLVLCSDQWSCTIVAVIKMHIWHGVGWVDVQMRTCLRLYNEKIWMWRNVQKDQWAIWAEAVSGHLSSSSGAFSLSFSLSMQTCMSFVWTRFSSNVSRFLPLTTKPQSSWWSSMNFPDCRRTCTLWERIFPR